MASSRPPTTPSTGPTWTRRSTSGSTSRRATQAASIYGRRMYEVMTSYWPNAGQRPERDAGDAPVRRDLERRSPSSCSRGRSTRSTTAAGSFSGDVGEELAKLREEFDGEIDVSGPEHRVAVHRARPGRRVPPRRPPGGHRRRHAVLPAGSAALKPPPDGRQALRLGRPRADLRGGLTSRPTYQTSPLRQSQTSGRSARAAASTACAGRRSRRRRPRCARGRPPASAPTSARATPPSRGA